MSTHSTRGHARLAPSSAHRWLNCTGSARLCAPIPNRSTEYADEGTAAHMLAERCLNNGKDAADYAGTWIPVRAGVRFKVVDEMVDGVQLYLDFVRELFEKCDFYSIEAKLDIRHVHEDIWGTGDAVGFIEADGHLHVVDFKYGRNVVEADENKQGLLYASGAARLYKGVKKITVHIVQPRAAHAQGAIRSWDTTPFWLEEMEARFRAAAVESTKPDAPLTSGEWCKYCPAAANCPALRTKALDAARVEFEAGLVVETPAPSDLTSVQLGEILKKAEDLAVWIDAVRKYAFLEAAEGRIPDGYKLVAKRAMRRWIDEASAVKALSDTFGMTGDDFYERKLLSPAKVEKLIGKVGKKQVAELVEKKSSGVVLAPENDPRPPAKPDAASEFGEAEE